MGLRRVVSGRNDTTQANVPRTAFTKSPSVPRWLGRCASRWTVMFLVSIAERKRHGEFPADGARKVFLDFVVPGNGFLAACLRVAPNGMAATLPNWHAAVLLKMAEQGSAFHASRSSAVSAFGSSRKTSSRSVSRMSCTASARFRRHSAFVSPWPFAPGTSRQVAQ